MRPETRTRRGIALAAVALAGMGLVAACGGKKSQSTAEVAPPTPTHSPAPAHHVKPWRNPLTGLAQGRGHRLLVVKIDNTHAAHPQVGLNLADVGYIEEVEGGLTRMAAVFSDKYPDTVGPVRSARETDIQLFAQYGKVAFAYSGAQPAVTHELERANLYLEEDGYGSGAWFRSSSRPAPYNLFGHPTELLAARPDATKVHPVGFRFGPAVKWMKPSKGFDVSFAAAHIAWRWDSSRHRFVLSMDYAPSVIDGHGALGASNVIVQYVDVHASDLHDVNGMPSPFTTTVGKGKALFFRDGRVVRGTWSRSSESSGTEWFVGKKAQRYPMATGHTWIVLVPKTSHVHLA